MSLSRIASAAAAAAALIVAAGCGTDTIDANKVEDGINQDARRKGVTAQVKSVECPEGEESKAGHRFNCTLTRTDGGTEQIPVVVTDGEKGSINFGTEAR